LIAYHSDLRSLALYGPDESAPGHAESVLKRFALWDAERPRRNFQLAVVKHTRPQSLIGCFGLRRTDLAKDRAEFGIELAPRIAPLRLWIIGAERPW